jgi:hypothetical protein
MASNGSNLTSVEYLTHSDSLSIWKVAIGFIIAPVRPTFFFTCPTPDDFTRQWGRYAAYGLTKKSDNVSS